MTTNASVLVAEALAIANDRPLPVLAGPAVPIEDKARAPQAIVPAPHAPAPSDPFSGAIAMQEEIEYKDRALELALAKVATKQRENQNLRRRYNNLEQNYHGLQHELQQLKACVNFRPGKRTVSAHGGYALAVGRALSHTSAQATAHMIAGEAFRGGLKSGATVFKYEALASLCQKAFSRQDSAAMTFGVNKQEATQQIVERAMEDASTYGTVHPIEFVNFRGDATNQEAIHREKVACCETCACGLDMASFAACMADMREHARASPDLSMILAYCSRRVGDLQVVRTGGGAEMKALMLRQLGSAFVPDWEQDLPSARSVRIYVMELDQGPDNKGATAKIKTDINPDAKKLLYVFWCLFHIFQLMVKSLLLTLDRWDWWSGWEDMDDIVLGDSDDWNNQVYVGLLATLVNTWKSPGVKKDIQAALAARFGELDAKMLGKAPGNLVRTRWASVDEVEKQLVKGLDKYAIVFWEVLETKLAGVGAARGRGRGRRGRGNGRVGSGI